MITFQWQDHPLGYPTDPDDTDFKSPRTPPFVSCAIRYEKDDVLLRNAIEFHDRTLKTLSADEQDHMLAMLENWLKDKLKEQP